MIGCYLVAVSEGLFADVTVSCISPEDFSCGFVGRAIEQSFSSLMLRVLASLPLPVSVDLSATLSAVVSNVLV